MKQVITQKQALMDAMGDICPAYITSALRREERYHEKGARRMSSPWITVAACLVVGFGVWLALLLGGALGPGLTPGKVDTGTDPAVVSEPLLPVESEMQTAAEEPTAEEPTDEEPTEAPTDPGTETAPRTETAPESGPGTVPGTDVPTAPVTTPGTETEPETEPETDSEIIAAYAIPGCRWSVRADGTLTVEASNPNISVAIPDFQKPGDAPWYPYREMITSVVVKAPLASIGQYAFYGLEAIRDTSAISLPETMKKIGDRAFASCGFLSLDLTGWDYTFGDYVFQNCTSLTQVSFPSTMTAISSGMFHGCSALEALTVPSTVKEIGAYSLQGTSLRTLILEDGGVERIGTYACYNLRSLERVELGDSLTEIGSNAFACCTSLREIDLPDSLTCIRDRAFLMTGIGPSMTVSAGCSLESDVFSDCDNLKELTILGARDSLPTISNSSLEVLSFPDITGEVAIPVQGYTTCTSLRTFSLGEGGVITQVGREGFYHCNNLEEVPLGVLTYVGERAFSYCWSLHPSVLYLQGTVGNNAFYRAQSLTNVMIDSGSQLGDGVFQSCAGLKHLWFADGVTVGNNCFIGCPGIMELYFPGEEQNTFDLTFIPITHTGCTREDFIAICLADRESAG